MNDSSPAVFDGYLTRLTLALVAGASHLPAERIERHREFVLGRQDDNGGWAGRDGQPDPYYTAFALRGLWIAGGIDPPVATRAADFLRSQMSTRQSVVDLMSLIFAAAILELAAGEVVIGDESDWIENVSKLMRSMRTDDGGFAKTPEGRAGSTYQSFLSVLCHELMGRPVDDPQRLRQFLAGQRQSDGGYLEIRVAKRAGVNPTAAAIGTLRCIDQLSAVDCVATREFLSERQNFDGGFSANTRIPFSDLLSTFTALWTMVDMADFCRPTAMAGDVAPPDRDRWLAADKYIAAMAADAGGFVGFELDDVTDVEYTFYGLAASALTAAALQETDR